MLRFCNQRGVGEGITRKLGIKRQVLGLEEANCLWSGSCCVGYSVSSFLGPLFFNHFTVEHFLDRIESVLSFTIVDSRTTFFIFLKEDRIGQN